MIASTSCLRDEILDQRLVADVADDQLGLARHRPVEAGRQVVEHDDALAGIDQLVDHVAADVAGAAGHQNAHVASTSIVGVSIPRT